MFVGSKVEGGPIPFDVPCYLVQAANLSYLAKNLCFEKYPNEDFQCRIHTTSKGDKLQFNFGIQLLFGENTEHSLRLGIDQRLEEREAVSLMVTFDKDQLEPSSLGSVVLNETGSAFEVEEVSNTEMTLYHGFAAFLELTSQLMEQIHDLSEEDIQQLAATDIDAHDARLEKEVTEIILATRMVRPPLDLLRKELNSAGVERFLAKQDVLVQIGIPSNLLDICLVLCSMMRERWKVKQRTLLSMPTTQPRTPSILAEDKLDSNETFGAFSSSEESEVEIITQSGAQITEDESDEDNMFEERNSLNDLMKELSKTARPFFDQSLEILFDCLKGNQTNCEAFIRFDQKLLQIFEFNRQMVGSIVAELYTYAFPSIDKLDDYYANLMVHFYNITQDNIIDQHLFTRIIRRLMDGGTYESDLFRNYCYQLMITVDVEIMSIKFTKSDRRLWVSFETVSSEGAEYTFADQMRDNPVLAAMDRKDIENRVYYAVDQLTDVEYIEYIRQCMAYFCRFEDDTVGEYMYKWNGVTSLLLVDAIYMGNIPIPIKVGALWMLDRLLYLYRPRQSKYILQFSDLPSGNSNPNDLVRLHREALEWPSSRREAALQDLRHAARLSLYLGSESKAFPLCTTNPLLVERVRFAEGLFRICLRLLGDGFATKEYIRFALGMVKVALMQLGKNYCEQSNWLTDVLKAAITNSPKDFELRGAVEFLYGTVFKLMSACINEAAAWHFDHFMGLLKTPYNEFRGGKAVVWNQVIQRITNEIMAPLEAFIWEKDQNALPTRRTLSRVAVSPIPSSELFDKETFYSLSEFNFTVPIPMLELLDSLYIDSVSFGILFEKKLLATLFQAVNIRLTIGKELEKIVIIDDKSTDLLSPEYNCKVSFSPDAVTAMTFGSTDTRIEGVQQVINTMLQHPFLNAVETLQAPEALRLLQMLTALHNDDSGDFFAYMFQQLREIEAEEPTQEQKAVIYTARAVVMKFLTTFVKDNLPGKVLIREWLKPVDMALLIPEVVVFALEYADFDYISTSEMQLIFQSLQENLRNSDTWTALMSYIFMQTMLEDAEIEAQNLVVCAVGEDVKIPLMQLVRKESLSEQTMRFVQLSILLLSDCARINSIARMQIVKLIDAKILNNLLENHRDNFTLLLALMTFIETSYRKDIEEQALNAVKTFLDIALEVLSRPQELLGVIRKNVYGEVPHVRIAQHSGLRLMLEEHEHHVLAQLRFLFYRSCAHEYGVLASAPHILRRLIKHKKATIADLDACDQQLQTIKKLISELNEEDFDFRHFHFRAHKSAQQMRKLIFEKAVKKDKQLNDLGVQSSSSIFRDTFTERLLTLYPMLKKTLGSQRLVKSLAQRVASMMLDPTKGKAEEALLVLYRKRPLFPMKTFAQVLVHLCNIMKPYNPEKLFKLINKGPILIGLFSNLGVSSNLRTNIAILTAINSLLHHQSPTAIENLKNILYERSLDSDLLQFMQQEIRQGFDTYRSWVLGESMTLYINSLGYEKHQTYADPQRRKALVKMHQLLVVQLMVLMQRFCDNCNQAMQNYARTQSTVAAFNINLVELVSEFLFSVCVITPETDIFNPDALMYITTALATLIEFATGPCKANQVMIGISIPLYLMLNKLLRMPPDDYYQFFRSSRPEGEEEEDDPVTTLRATVTKLLETLLEGDPDPDVMSLIDKYLDKQLFVQHAKRMYQFFGSMIRKVETENASVRLVTAKVANVLEEVCFLVAFLQKYNNKPLNSVLTTEEDLQPYRNFYLNYVGYVEIDMNPEIQIEEKTTEHIRDVFFVIPFKTRFLPLDSAEEVLKEVDHESLQGRKEGFLRSVQMRKRDMEHHQRLARWAYLHYVFPGAYYLKLTSFIIVIIINITLFAYDDQSMLKGEGYNDPSQVFFLVVLGIIQLICYSLGAALHTWDSYTKIIDKYREKDEGMKFERLAFQDDRESQRIIYLDEIEYPREVASETGMNVRIKHWNKQVQAILRYRGNQAALIYLGLSITSLIMPMMYPLTLLQIFDHMSHLSVVLQAITYNGFQLFVTALFGLLLLVLFAVGTFAWFSIYFTGDNSPNLIYCDALWDCVTSTMHWGLLSGGGMGDAMGTANKGRYWGRLAFDIIFFIIIKVIMLNIIFGIIIDTFGELREKRNQTDEDINSRCFVCGLDRNEIELHGKGWPYHFRNEHSPFAYLSFFIYLTDKPLADCSGVEKYAKLNLADINIGFLPTTSRLMVMSKSY